MDKEIFRIVYRMQERSRKQADWILEVAKTVRNIKGDFRNVAVFELAQKEESHQARG